MAKYGLIVKTMGVIEEETERRRMMITIRFLALNLPAKYPPIKGVKGSVYNSAVRSWFLTLSSIRMFHT
jgi:hypothetical protein